MDNSTSDTPGALLVAKGALLPASYDRLSIILAAPGIATVQVRIPAVAPEARRDVDICHPHSAGENPVGRQPHGMYQGASSAVRTGSKAVGPVWTQDGGGAVDRCAGSSLCRERTVSAS